MVSKLEPRDRLWLAIDTIPALVWSVLPDSSTAFIDLGLENTVGELAGSIAHEVNQPLAGVITNGNACLRWLGHTPPDVDEVREAVRRMIRDGSQASEVMARIRTLVRKAEPQKTRLAINDVIGEVIALAES
jgi:C4-dicarboxylate-specific signal transduction histidine kinase